MKEPRMYMMARTNLFELTIRRQTLPPYTLTIRVETLSRRLNTITPPGDYRAIRETPIPIRMTVNGRTCL